MAGTVQTSPGVAITPSSVKAVLPTNYITNFDFLNQYLPDTYEREFERYGDRSIASFLRGISAEIPTTSDLIKWNEQGRLHTKYKVVNADSAVTTDTALFSIAGATKCVFRKNQTVILSAESGTLVAKAIISGVGLADSLADDQQFQVKFYNASGSPFALNDKVTAFVYGSEFSKGTNGMEGSLEAEVDIFETKPIIIKDKYEVSGSDMAQIGWIEVEGDNGMGYLWYLKSQHETRLRYEDYLEMSMIEAVPAENGSAAEAYLSTNTGGGNAGMEGLLETVETRGNLWSAGYPTTLADFDLMVARLDAQGAIAENAIFDNREFSFAIDDMLAAQNGAVTPSFGMFDNDQDMALNLGFSGFKRGYEFYKTDWRYLNDPTLRGGLTAGKVNGLLVPSGTKKVYDEVAGGTQTRPFLHVRYKQSANEDRKMKTWITGSAGGANNSDLDAMQVNYLSERALCTLGANNFFLFKG